ncbi:MAG: hypothetical protein RSC95_08085, partial [Anaerovoracaceae bacterium]
LRQKLTKTFDVANRLRFGTTFAPPSQPKPPPLWHGFCADVPSQHDLGTAFASSRQPTASLVTVLAQLLRQKLTKTFDVANRLRFGMAFAPACQNHVLAQLLPTQLVGMAFALSLTKTASGFYPQSPPHHTKSVAVLLTPIAQSNILY